MINWYACYLLGILLHTFMTHGNHLRNLLILLINHLMDIVQDGDPPQPFFCLPHSDSFACVHDNFGFLKVAYLDTLQDSSLFRAFLG